MSDYKIDSLAIQEKSQSIALEKFGEIESNCQLSPVAFVKENHTFKKIRERLTEPHFGVTLGVMMAKVCAYAGIKNEITDHDKFDIGRAIKNRFSDLSCEEFMKAFENERHGIYAERTEHFQLFNAEYVTSVLNKWKKWRQETKITHNINYDVKSVLQNKSVDIDKLNAMSLRDGTVNRFEQFKKGEPIETPIIHIFDYLRDNNIFPPDMPDDLIYKVALRETKKDLEFMKYSGKGDRQDINEALSQIKNNVVNAKVLSKARLLAIEHFFQKLIDEKKDINEILK